MDFVKGIDESKKKALEVAEDARETEWTAPSFLAQLFAGKVDWNMVSPFPEQSADDKAIGDEFLKKLEVCVKEHLDPEAVDQTGDIPAAAIAALAALGCFALKVPKEYGGVGLSQVNYNRVMALLASYCGSTTVLLSAHQSIGVPQPLMLFGTAAQKKKYLPQFAKGAISAFALTEPDVGSDPAQMSTTATPVDNGDAYLLNGDKLWCTNGVVADVLIVMAQTEMEVKGKIKKRITAFIVEKDMPGFEIVHRCHFMGLHGIQNGLLRFTNVRVPRENILWGLGEGLKLALITLNTGRLTLPAASAGAAKWCLNVARKWSNKRAQWGTVIGKHDAIADKLANMAATTFAMDSVAWLTANLADQKKTDMRLEAAMGKLFCTEASWRIVDETVQIRGGRGYEKASSLAARGEDGIPVERAMRDLRINLIIEGTSEIMRLFISREAMDMHLKYIFPILNPKTPLGAKIATIFKATAFYALWFPRQFIPFGRKAYAGNAPSLLKPHFRFVEKTAPKLARTLFMAMLFYQDKLERRQRVLFRLVNIGTDLFAIAAACSHAALLHSKNPNDDGPSRLANLFSRAAERRINRSFHGVFVNDDQIAYKIACDVLDEKYTWLEEGIIPYSSSKGKPETVS